MKKYKENDIVYEYLGKLNALLEKGGFNERFIVSENLNDKNAAKKLVLHNLTDADKTIEIIFDEYEGILYYLNCNGYFFGISGENACSELFETVADILCDGFLTVNHYKDNGKLLAVHSIRLLPDYDSVKYTPNEKERLDDPLIEYRNWSGNLTDEMKLFAVGKLFTDLREIAELEFLYGNTKNNCETQEKIVWKGAPVRTGSFLLLAKRMGINFLTFTGLFLLIFRSSWEMFIFCEIFVVISVLSGFFIAAKKIKNDNYVITEKSVIINYTELTVKYSLDAILSMKIKYHLFNKGKTIGTVKIKVKKRWFTHIYYVEEPQKVYSILEKYKAAAIEKSKNDSESV
jgi:ABC-type multidrug transport system fused ATPase/permease subunit